MACFLSLMVTVSMVLTPFIGVEVKAAPAINVASGNFNKTDNVAELKSEANLLYDREFTKVFQKDGSSTNTTAYTETNKKLYTDGDLNTSRQLNGKIYYNTDGTPKNTAPYTDPQHYTDVTYSFSDNANVDEIWVYHHTNNELVGYVYQLYLSDDLATLYNSESLITTYTNTAKESYQKFKFSETVENKQYFGIRYLVATPTNTSLGAFARITELAVIGELKPLDLSIDSGNFQKTDTVAELKEETNLLYDREFTKVFQKNGDSTNTTAYNGGSNKKIFTDGDLNTSQQLNGKIYYNADGTPKNTYPYKDPQYYTDLTYSFADNANVSEIWVYHHTNSELVGYVYQLYLSDSLSTLYEEESLVTTYTNSGKQSYQKFKFKEAYKDKQYFGIRYLVATPTNTSLGAVSRITELAVIGEYAPLSNEIIESKDYTQSNTVSYELKTPGNLLYGRKYEEVYQNNNGEDTSAAASGQIKNAPNALTDGITGTNTFLPGRIYYNEDTKVPNNTAPFEDAKYYTDLTYSFAEKSDVSSIWVYNHPSDELVNYAYELYLSDSKDTLYTEANRVIAFVNENLDKMQKFSFRTPYTDKKYVGIRFLMPTKEYSANGSVVRIAELAVMGTSSLPEATVTTGTHQSTDSVEELKGETNILYGKEVTVLQNNGGTTNKTAVPADNVPKFTDGDLSTIGQANGAIYYKDNETPRNTAPYLSPAHYTDFTYFFDGLAEVSEIRVYNHHNNKLATEAYQLFLSDTEEGLFTADSLVATYENTDGSTNQKFVFTEKQKGKRYFGIRFLNSVPVDSSFLDGSRYVRVAELAVIGKVEKEVVRVHSDNYTQNADDAELKADNNLLLGKEYNQIVQFNNGDYSGSVGAETDLKADPTAITDGGTNDSVRLLNQIYYNADGTPKNTEPYTNPKYYTTLTYFLGGSSTVNEVWVYHHNNPELTTKVYQLYMSDSRANLYDEASLVTTYVNEGNETRQKFTFPEALTGKQYVGIKFLVSAPYPNSYTVNTLYLRIAQLAVFGTVDTVTEEDKSAFDPEKDFYEKLEKKYDRNLISGKTAQIFSYDGVKATQISPEKVSSLTDGSNANAFFTGNPRFAEYISAEKSYYYDNGEDRYLKLQYNMGTLCDVGAVLMVHHSNEDLRTYSYEIYLSDNKDTLWDEESKIEDHVNTALEQKELFEYSEAKQGKYIGIKVKYPVSKNVTVKEDENLAYVRINEISVYGSYSDPNYVEPPSYAIGEMTDEDLKKLGTSLISGMAPTIRFNGTPMSKSHYGYKEMKFVDGIMSPHVDVVGTSSGSGKLTTTDGSERLDIIYDFNDVKYDFTSFLFAGIYNPASTQYFTGWYQVYIAEDYDDLFAESSMVFEYNWEGERFERGHYVTFDEVKRGSFFAIRILNPVSGAEQYIAPRISEIAAYGVKSKIIVKPTNLASNMPIEAYTSNENGELKEIGGKNLTTKEVKNLTDNSDSTSATITADGKVQLLYNLCNDAVIDQYKLVSNAKKYKIYASSSLDDVWTDSALIYSYNGKGKNGLTLKKGRSVRYVRFEISDFGSALKISEIKCIGGDDQLLKHKVLSRNFEAKQVSVYMYNLAEKKQEFPRETTQGTLARLFDSGLLAPVGVYGGKHNEVAIDMILHLDDVRNIDNIAITFPEVLPGYSPTKFEVYTSENVDSFDFGEFDEKPAVQYDGKPVRGTYNVSFRPRLARSLLVRFIAGDTTYDPYNNGQMVFAVTELEVKGTPVKGMQKDPEKEELISFHDKDTDVTVDILKFDRNDIYTDVHSIKVETIPANMNQKQSLASQGPLKIIGESIYKVTLRDIFGKEVKDADGRLVRISMPCDIEKYGYPVVAGVEGNDVMAVEAISDEKYSSVTVNVMDKNQYLVATYADPEDPYFENLEVYVPDEIIPDGDGSFLPDGENSVTPDADAPIEDGTDLPVGDSDDALLGGTTPDDFENMDQSGTSPETGEDLPAFAIALFISATGLVVVSRKKSI